MEKWVSEKHKSWGMPAEGFKVHVATDGSLLEEEFEVQRTIKRAEAFLCILNKVIGPTKVHVDNKRNY